MAEESKLAEKLENITKFSEEEMEKVKSFQEKYFEIQSSFGDVEIAKIRLNDRYEELEEAFEKLKEDFKTTQEEEKTFLDQITEKYGQGSLNPATGEFTPNKS
jgi:hypothetical protein